MSCSQKTLFPATTETRAAPGGTCGTSALPFQTWALSLVGNLVAPIFDGGERAADVDIAKADLRIAVHSYSTAVLAALGEVENALVSEARQRDVLTSLDKQLELARQVLKRVEEAYAAGMTDYLRVIEAQETLQGLERQILAGRLALIDTRIALCRALAGGWELTRPDAARAG